MREKLVKWSEVPYACSKHIVKSFYFYKKKVLLAKTNLASQSYAEETASAKLHDTDTVWYSKEAASVN